MFFWSYFLYSPCSNLFCRLSVSAGVLAKTCFRRQSLGFVLASAEQSASCKCPRLAVLPRQSTDVGTTNAFVWQFSKPPVTLSLFSQVSRTATGILGETFVPKLDSSGNPIMSGMEAIRGTQDDCELLRTRVPQHPALSAQITQTHRTPYLESSYIL